MLLHRVPSRSSRTHLFHGTRVVPEQVQGKHTLVGYGALDDVVEPSFPHLGDRIPRHGRHPYFPALGSASHARVSSHRRRQGPPSTRQVRRHRRRLSSCDVAIVGGTARPVDCPLDLTHPICGLNTPPHGWMAIPDRRRYSHRGRWWDGGGKGSETADGEACAWRCGSNKRTE